MFLFLFQLERDDHDQVEQQKVEQEEEMQSAREAVLCVSTYGRVSVCGRRAFMLG